VLYSIGHSTRSYDELVDALRAWGVTTLVDIRSITRSRANPQFDRARLARRLPRAGIAYVTLPGLGGRRPRSKTADPARNAGWRVAAFHHYADYAETPAFADALASLLALARSSTCAMMCAEAVWWRCHRRIVADYAMLRGVPVSHIFTSAKVERAVRTPFARLDRKTRTLRYAPAATASRSRPAATASRSRPAATASRSRPAARRGRSTAPPRTSRYPSSRRTTAR
jgi:uncharacterized protein (DUF488 family)